MAKQVIATIETGTRSFIGSSSGCSRRIISVEMDRRAAEKDRVAVGQRMRHNLRRERPARARLVVDEHRAEFWS